MGNRLIIKDANFTNVSIENVSNNWVSLVDNLFQSFISNTSSGYALYNANYNSSNSLIPRYVMLMESLDAFYNSSGKYIRIFLPDTVRIRVWAMKTLLTPNASNGLITGLNDSNLAIASTDGYIVGTNQWISLSTLCYETLGVSEAVYPYYGATFARSSPNTSSNMSVQNLIDLGFGIEEYVNS